MPLFWGDLGYKGPPSFFAKRRGKKRFCHMGVYGLRERQRKNEHTHTPTQTHEAINLLAGKPDEPFVCSGGQSDNMTPKNIKNMIHHSKAPKNEGI